MSQALDQILQELGTLTEADFDMSNVGARGQERLYDLMQDLRVMPHAETAIPALFRTMERMPYADLGNPGPLVHAIEAIGKNEGYESELEASLERKPTPLAVLMVNRILNVTEGSWKRTQWLRVLERAADHPHVTDDTEDDARHIIHAQKKKRREA